MRAPLPRTIPTGTCFVKQRMKQPRPAARPKRVRHKAPAAAPPLFHLQLPLEPLALAQKGEHELERGPAKPAARLNSRRAFFPCWLPATWVRESLSVSGDRAKFATSLCRRCTPKLRQLLRNSILQGHAKSPRCETPRALRARPTARRACRRCPESQGASALLPAPHQSKRFSADGA